MRKLLRQIQKKQFCRLNQWYCPDCIYHDFIFEGSIFRGNRCRFPMDVYTRAQQYSEIGNTKRIIQKYIDEIDHLTDL